jgi:valyl-tRNA synthetase
VIEPLISLQWFMRMDELKAPATDVVREGRIRFFPERWRRVYIDWMESLRPWCISRQLWWGHQLPVWYCEEDGCGQVIVAESEPAMCPGCNGTSLRRDDDVLDTWFSSALWPFATWGWPDETPDLAYFYPTSVLTTAREIIFLWVARMVMMGLEFVGEIPFGDVYIHSVIQAADGRRMSKSLGNGVDPLAMIDKYGADATRFGLLLMSSTQDVRFSEEKIAMGRGFANKLWNAARLVLLAAEGVEAERSTADVTDRWIASRLARCATAVEKLLGDYAFAAAADTLYHFVWDEFCDWYLEMVKPRLYGDELEDQHTAAAHTRWLLDAIVRLLHPFLPYVTEEIAAQYGAAPLLERSYAVAGEDALSAEDEEAVGTVQVAVGALRAYRADSKVAPAQVLTARFAADDEAVAHLYQAYAAAFRSLARIEVVFGDSRTQAENVVLVPGGLFELAAQEVDREDELVRLRAQLAKVEAEVLRCEAKLTNESFVAKAPADVVAGERAKLAAYRADRDELARRSAQLEQP